MADTLGTLSISIEANVLNFENALTNAIKKVELFRQQIDKDLDAVNAKFTKLNVKPVGDNLNESLKNVTTFVKTLQALPNQLDVVMPQIKAKLTGIDAALNPAIKSVGALATAFQRLSSGVDKTAQKVLELDPIFQRLKQFQNNIANLGNTGGSSGAGPAGVNNLSNVVSNFNTQLGHANRSLSMLKGGMHEAGTQGNWLVRMLTGLDLPLSQVLNRIILINSVWKAWGFTLRSVREGIDNLIETDQALRNIQAITLSTGKEFETLKTSISTALVSSKFSAAELADTFVQLGQAGLSGAEATKAFASTVQLATGTITSLEDSVQILTTIIRAYNIDAGETADITNKLVAATNTSKLSIEGLNTAFNFVGPAAAEANISLEGTLGALAVMADNGIKASTQGTGLRQVIAALISPSDAFKERIYQLGLNMGELNPLTNDLSDILLKLKDAGFTASDAFRTLQLRTAGAFSVLVQNAETVEAMTNAINESSSAMAASLLQSQGLEFQFKNLQQQFNSIFLESKGLESNLRLLIDVGNSFIDTIRAWMYAAQQVSGTIRGLKIELLALLAILIEVRTAYAVWTKLATGGIFVSLARNIKLATTELKIFGAALLGMKASMVDGIFYTGAVGSASLLATFGAWAIALATLAAVVYTVKVAYDSWMGTQEESVELSLEHIKTLEKETEALQKRKDALEGASRTQGGFTTDSDGTFVSLDKIRAANDLIAKRVEYYNYLRENSTELVQLAADEQAEFVAQNQAIQSKLVTSEAVYAALLKARDANTGTIDTVAELTAQLKKAETITGKVGLSADAQLAELQVDILNAQAKQKLLNDEFSKFKDILNVVVPVIKEEMEELRKSNDEANPRYKELADKLKLAGDSLEYFRLNMVRNNLETDAYVEGVKSITLAYKDLLDNMPKDLPTLESANTDVQFQKATVVANLEEARKKAEDTQALIDKLTADIPNMDSAIYNLEQKSKLGGNDYVEAEKKLPILRKSLQDMIDLKASYTYQLAGESKEVNRLKGELDGLLKVEKMVGDTKQTTVAAQSKALADDIRERERRLKDELAQQQSLLEMSRLRQQIAETEFKRTGDRQQLDAAINRENEIQLGVANTILQKKKTAEEDILALLQRRLLVTQEDAESETVRNQIADHKAELAQIELDMKEEGLKRTLELEKTENRLAESRSQELKNQIDVIALKIEGESRLLKIQNKQYDNQVAILEARKDLAVSTQEELELSQDIYNTRKDQLENEMGVLRSQIEDSLEALNYAAERYQDTNIAGERGANKELEAIKQRVAGQAEQYDLAKQKLVLLDLELEKTNEINEAWRGVARTINDGYAEALTSVIFGDKTQKEAFKDYKDSIVDGFKNVFKESIKAKVTLLDKPFKGNIAELGQEVIVKLGGSFKKAFGMGGETDPSTEKSWTDIFFGKPRDLTAGDSFDPIDLQREMVQNTSDTVDLLRQIKDNTAKEGSGLGDILNSDKPVREGKKDINQVAKEAAVAAAAAKEQLGTGDKIVEISEASSSTSSQSFFSDLFSDKGGTSFGGQLASGLKKMIAKLVEMIQTVVKTIADLFSNIWKFIKALFTGKSAEAQALEDANSKLDSADARMAKERKEIGAAGAIEKADWKAAFNEVKSQPDKVQEVTETDSNGNTSTKTITTKGKKASWGDYANAGVSLLGPILASFLTNPQADARGTEKTFNQISSLLQTLAGTVSALGGWVGALAGAAMYAASIILPLFAPDRGMLYLRGERDFLQEAFLAAGGDNFVLPTPTNEGYGRGSKIKNPDEIGGERSPIKSSANRAVWMATMGPLGEVIPEDLGLMLLGDFSTWYSGLLSVLIGPLAGFVTGLFSGGGELQAMNRYIQGVADKAGLYLPEPSGTRARFNYSTTRAFSNELIDRGTDPEQLKKIVQAMSAMELVKAAGTKQNKAYELSMTAVNGTLARFIELNYDLNKVNIDSLLTSFRQRTGGFDKIITTVNNLYEKFLNSDAKVAGFDINFIKDVIDGAVLLFADTFPKGINVARRAMQELATSGKIDLEKFREDIQATLQKVGEAANKIAENPLKILVETGSSTQALNDFGKQVDSFIKNTLIEDTVSLLSNSVLEKGFLTPIYEDIEEISSQFYAAEINASQFGSKLRALFTENLIPNIGVFKNILKETFATLSGSIGFPLDQLAGLYGDSTREGGFGLAFNSRTEVAKSFTQKYLEAIAVSDEVQRKKETGQRIKDISFDLTTDNISQATENTIVNNSMAGILTEIFNTAKDAGGILDREDIDEEKLRPKVRNFVMEKKHPGFPEMQVLKNPPVGTIAGVYVASVTESGGDRDNLDRYSFSIRIEYWKTTVGKGKIQNKKGSSELGGTKEGVTLLGDAYEAASRTRSELIEQFIAETDISMTELNRISANMFKKSFELLDPEQTKAVLNSQAISEAIQDELNKVLRQIENMDDDVRKSLRRLANNLTTADEFGSFYSALRQAFDEGFLNQKQFDNILEKGIASIQQELPNKINVQQIFEDSFNSIGELDIDKFRDVLANELSSFGQFKEGISSAFVEALSSGKITQATLSFTKFLKKNLGDAVLSAFVDGITNKVFIEGIFGPFLQELGVRIAAFGRGQITVEDINAFIQRELPGVSGAITQAGEVLTPLLESVYSIFSSTGLLDGYTNALDKQETLIKKQLEVAEKWDEILKSARDVRSGILFGEGSPQQIRQQLKDAQAELTRELTAFRTTKDPTARQEAAGNVVSLVQKLFQLGNSAGEAGLADFQSTSASFQIFSKNLVGILDEIVNAALNGSSQLDLLRKQVELLTMIEENTRGAGNLGTGDPNATGAMTQKERALISRINAELRRFKDEEDFRRSSDWELMTQEERDNQERDWAWLHSLEKADIDRQIDTLKSADQQAYDAERAYRRTSAYTGMTEEQQNAWDDARRAEHQRTQDIIDGLEQNYEDMLIEAAAYRENEPNPDEAPPALDKETVDTLKESNIALDTSVQELNATIREAYELDEEEGSGSGAGTNSNVEYGYISPLGSAEYNYEARSLTAEGIVNPLDNLVQLVVNQQSLLQEMLLNLVSTMTDRLVPAIETMAYNGSVQIIINGNATPEAIKMMNEEVEKTIVRSIRRGRAGVEVARKLR